MFWSLKYSLLCRAGLAAESELAKCSDPPHPQESILFIGNSFTYYSNMPMLFYKLAEERHPNKSLRVFLQGGGGLQLWQHAGSRNTKTTLMNSGKWDVVVLQEQSEMPLSPGGVKSMDESCRWFADAVNRVQGRPALLMTWCDLNDPAKQPAISKAYRDIGRQLNALVIPAGDLFLEITKKDPSIKLYDQDNHHPSYHGSYLVACLSEAMLLETKSDLENLVRNRRTQTSSERDPVELKLQEYADEFAIREMSSAH